MDHKTFMHTLCQIVSAWSEKETRGDSGPCFCGESIIARMEMERGVWKGSEALLRNLANKLEVEFPKDKG
jgi:hypothetical protein